MKEEEKKQGERENTKARQQFCEGAYVILKVGKKNEERKKRGRDRHRPICNPITASTYHITRQPQCLP
jgi:hypothetical protein